MILFVWWYGRSPFTRCCGHVSNSKSISVRRKNKRRFCARWQKVTMFFVKASKYINIVLLLGNVCCWVGRWFFYPEALIHLSYHTIIHTINKQQEEETTTLPLKTLNITTWLHPTPLHSTLSIAWVAEAGETISTGFFRTWTNNPCTYHFRKWWSNFNYQGTKVRWRALIIRQIPFNEGQKITIPTEQIKCRPVVFLVAQKMEPLACGISDVVVLEPLSALFHQIMLKSLRLDSTPISMRPIISPRANIPSPCKNLFIVLLLDVFQCHRDLSLFTFPNFFLPVLKDFHRLVRPYMVMI